ncbi:hypothetical protein [Salinimicrobium gaetbulicola]|uniref:SdpI/YhfL family protein n=1 Tax=Salinimicrobium gaetbulicola TaxID=999702 RepID=A0ABW3IBH3_9FLAO
MKNSETKKPHTFQKQFDKFHLLILGSKMAKLSSLILMFVSLIIMFYSEKSILVILSLLIGVAVLGVYILKFLPLNNIEQKPYTKASLTSSLTKFKAYIEQRKKFEILFISVWFLTLIPFLSTYLGSNFKALIVTILVISITAVLGMLAFIRVEKELRTLETQIQSKI